MAEEKQEIGSLETFRNFLKTSTLRKKIKKKKKGEKSIAEKINFGGRNK